MHQALTLAKYSDAKGNVRKRVHGGKKKIRRRTLTLQVEVVEVSQRAGMSLEETDTNHSYHFFLV